MSDNSIQEPTQADYESMLNSLEVCLGDMGEYDAGDAAYTRLTLYQQLLNMISVNIRGLALNNIAKENVMAAINTIADAAKNESVTQKTSLELQDMIAKQVENILDNVTREYESMKRG